METVNYLIEIFQHQDFRSLIYSGDINAIRVLTLLMIIDVITGIFKAIKNRNLWSRKALFGYARKILIFLIITVSNLLDFMMNLNGTLVLATVTFYILNEVLSITENMGQLGVPISPKLLNVINVMQEKDKTTDKVEELIYNEEDKNDKRD